MLRASSIRSRAMAEHTLIVSLFIASLTNAICLYGYLGA
jgi:hypothetical protein